MKAAIQRGCHVGGPHDVKKSLRLHTKVKRIYPKASDGIFCGSFPFLSRLHSIHLMSMPHDDTSCEYVTLYIVIVVV